MFFYDSKTPKWSNAGNKWGGKTPQTKKSKFYSKWHEQCQYMFSSFSRFLIAYLEKPIKSHWLKSWQFNSWKLNLKACIHCKLKFYPSVLLLMIHVKMSQSVHKKVDSYCKIPLCNINKMLATQVRRTKTLIILWKLSGLMFNHDTHYRYM